MFYQGTPSAGPQAQTAFQCGNAQLERLTDHVGLTQTSLGRGGSKILSQFD